MENTKKQNSMWSAPVIIAAVVSALLLLAVLAFSLVSRTGYFDRKNVAMTVGEEPISVLEFQYNYANAVNAFYSEYYDYSLDSQINYGMAFVVMQYSKDGYAYYYADECYIPYFDTTSDWNSISEQMYGSNFPVTEYTSSCVARALPCTYPFHASETCFFCSTLSRLMGMLCSFSIPK